MPFWEWLQFMRHENCGYSQNGVHFQDGTKEGNLHTACSLSEKQGIAGGGWGRPRAYTNVDPEGWKGGQGIKWDVMEVEDRQMGAVEASLQLVVRMGGLQSLLIVIT